MLPIEEPLDFIVLIPYYNDSQGLMDALSSIRYSPDRYGVLVVDDGSSEPLTLSSIRSHSKSGNCFLVTIPSNRGITHALNKGLEYLYKNCQFRYVARLDCGDTCAPERFIRQVAYLDANERVLMAGSWCHFIEPVNKRSFIYKTPVTSGGIRLGMYFRNLFIHPTMMWRRELRNLQDDYPTNFPLAEDYALAFNIMKKGKVAILPEPLVNCRLHENGLSLSKRKEQLNSRSEVVWKLGRNRLLGALGVFKMKLMMKIPYNWVFAVKRLIHGRQPNIQY